ncbi:MAG: hypothetical protein K6G33_00315 [Ruminococcus sp.]|uniref:hypothetical protein n=1 Tax=Ruminococcus sp. TaxID=41978 RepID=UPI0025D9FF87|nr:hypothetical protein [Ruminococcus sp.]MCR5599176.1 hypothetical protein [Ruminococcus sp.]
MAQIKPTNGNCPDCGKPISGYNASSRDYGSPIKTCKCCGQQYLDRRYIELAVEPPDPSDLSAATGLKMALIGLGMFAVSGGFTLFTIHFRGYYYRKMAFVAIASIVVMLFGIIDSIRTKTGAKQKSLDKKREASEQRLMDRAYAQQLADLGYNVPDKYL